MPYPIIPRAQHGGPQGAQDGVLDFSVNTNPLGPNPALLKIWREAEVTGYPDPYYRRAREALAAYHGCDPEGVVLGVGASELLHRVVRAFVGKGDEVISLGAPFGEFARAVALQEASLKIMDRETVTVARGLIYLSNPHNPTGHVLNLDQVSSESLIVVDEAYRPFLESASEAREANVIRVQSPGKAQGVLGMRLAYALATPEVAAPLVNLQPAWAIPGATAAVLAALPGQEDFLAETMPTVRGWARDLAKALGAEPTGVHFFTVAVEDAPRVAGQLLAQGIRVRDCTSFELPGRVRVATRTPEENAVLIEAWQDIKL